MPAIYAALAQDIARNDLIFDDVLKSLEAKRSPIVLTERKDHLDYLQNRFSPFVRNLVVLRGGMSTKDRKAASATLKASGDDERLILATGRYVGEGFDDSRLDTLFLTMPIAWKGTLAQYVGRLHREREGKRMFWSWTTSIRRFLFSPGWLRSDEQDIARWATWSSSGASCGARRRGSVSATR